MALWIARTIFLAHIGLAAAQCYVGPGAENRGPSNLVPCQGDGQSSCCLLGDVCLSGNACWDYTTGNTYQYGCTDITYQDASCPFKCGWNATQSGWTALEYCSDSTWVCQSPESCGCEWEPSWDLLVLAPRGCQAMGNEARVGLYGPESVPPYLLLPSTAGGSTSYFSYYTLTDGTVTWDTTAVAGYTPSSVGPVIDLKAPTKIVELYPNVKPAPATLPPAVPYGVSATTPTAPVSTASFTSHSMTSSAPSHNPTTTSASSSRTSSTSSAASSSSTTQAKHSSSGLSSSAKIGVGVGVGVGVGIFLAALAIFFFLYNRKRRQQKKERPDSDSEQSNKNEKRGTWQKHSSTGTNEWGFDPNAEYVGAPAVIHEAPSPQPEMSTLPKTPPAELETVQPVYELSSESRHTSAVIAAPPSENAAERKDNEEQ